MPYVGNMMDLEIIILSEVRHERQIYVEYKKKDMKGLICRTETDSQTLETKGTGARSWRDGLRVRVWHRHTVVYGMTGQCGDLLYSTGRATSYSVKIHMEKEWMCVYV